MAVKKSRIKKIRELYLANHLFIKSYIRIDDLSYNDQVLETGLLFLSELFPENTIYEKYNKRYSFSPKFWIWWTSEWKKWEHQLIEYIQVSDSQLTKSDWASEMQKMVFDKYVSISFTNNYQNK